jgi:hypothetical protein
MSNDITVTAQRAEGRTSNMSSLVPHRGEGSASDEPHASRGGSAADAEGAI